MANDFGFKRADFENWLTMDTLWNGVNMTNLPGDQVEGWIKELNAVNLSASVPIEVRKLFEVARAAMIYSVLYYPFLALGAEQMLRTAESAIANKCKAMNAPAGMKIFAQRIDWLETGGALNAGQKAGWHEMREMRNEGAHPKDQSIQNVAMALTTMDTVVTLIDELFR